MANGIFFFLVGRPLSPLGRCTLGRETAIQRIIWNPGEWPTLAQGGNEPDMVLPAPGLPLYEFEQEEEVDDFTQEQLNMNFQALRRPMDESWISLKENPGYLRLFGGDSLSSCFNQSLVARRVQSHQVEVATSVLFEPPTFQQMAGLVCYYNTCHYHYLYISTNSRKDRKVLTILSCDNHRTTEPVDEMELPNNTSSIKLKVRFIGAEIQFYFSWETDAWNEIGPVLDGSILSDDYVQNTEGRYRPAFTGAFIGINCIDLSGSGIPADFEWFSYRNLK